MRIGRYLLGAPLGEGGQGRVFEAVHGSRRVALKLLEHRGSDLVREARIAALLRHPNLVDVFEVGEQDGTWFCAMELCDGGSLDGRPALPPRAVVDVGLQVCEALAYAHDELELVHLDLKPANLLLARGAVKVADLGISRARGFGDDGLVRGTPRYVAPEQRRGLAVDVRTDIYALGLVLRDLAVGAGVDADATVPVDGAEPAPELPAVAWLEPIVLRCTAPRPEDRYTDMRELSAALRRLDVAGPTLREWLGVSADPTPPPDRFFGRRALLGRILEHLDEGGLLTLKGPGGIGKTRLARVVAAGRGEAWFVDLSDARTLDDLVQRVAHGLGVPLHGSTEARAERIGDALRVRGDVLIVLDNLEQLVPDVGVVLRWQQAAPRSRFLATSRTPLGLAGERVVEVPPLGEAEAVSLLVGRARERGAEVAGDPALLELARRLDGVPLALELAAGRLGVLSPAEVLERLGLSLLRSGQLGLSGRQATLRGALDWSWSLLGATERRALAELSVFWGGFTFEDAGAVLTAPEALDVLLDHSLVVRRAQRLHLLATVRAYADERLDELQGRVGAETRHGAWFARFGRIDPLLPRSPEEAARVLDRAPHLQNLAAASRRAVARGDGEVAALAALGAARAYRDLVRLAEGVELATQALSVAPEGLRGRLLLMRSSLLRIPGDVEGADRDLDAAAALIPVDPDLEAQVLLTRGRQLLGQGDPDGARASLLRSIALLEARGRCAGPSRLVLFMVEQAAGRIPESEAVIEAALRDVQRVGDRWAEARAHAMMGDLQLTNGRMHRAEALYRRGLAIAREVGAPYETLALRAILGRALWNLERHDEARPLIEEAAAGLQRLGMNPSAVSALEYLVDLFLAEGEPDRAQRHLDAARALQRRLNSPASEGFHRVLAARIEALQGRYDVARRFLDEAVERYERAHAGVRIAFARVVAAQLELRAGRPTEALQLVDQALPVITWGPYYRPYAVAVRAEALAGTGDVDQARALLTEALPTLRQLDTPIYLRLALCCGARALGDRSLLAEAEAIGAPVEGSEAWADLELARSTL